VVTLALFTLLQIPTALVRNYPGLLILHFLCVCVEFNERQAIRWLMAFSQLNLQSWDRCVPGFGYRRCEHRRVLSARDAGVRPSNLE
jgi:hypothetical protein